MTSLFPKCYIMGEEEEDEEEGGNPFLVINMPHVVRAAPHLKPLCTAADASGRNALTP